MPIDAHIQANGSWAGIGFSMHTEVCLQVDIQIVVIVIDSPVDCIRLVIQRDTDKMMIDLNAKKFVASVNAIEGLAVWGKSFGFY